MQAGDKLPRMKTKFHQANSVFFSQGVVIAQNFAAIACLQGPQGGIYSHQLSKMPTQLAQDDISNENDLHQYRVTDQPLTSIIFRHLQHPPTNDNEA